MGNAISHFLYSVLFGNNLWTPANQPGRHDIADDEILDERLHLDFGSDTDTDDSNEFRRAPRDHYGPYPPEDDVDVDDVEWNQVDLDENSNRIVRYLNWDDLNDAYLIYSNLLQPGFYAIRLNNLIIVVGIRGNGDYEVYQAEFIVQD